MKKIKWAAVFLALTLMLVAIPVGAQQGTFASYRALSTGGQFVYDSMTITENTDWLKWARDFAPAIQEEYIDFVSDPGNRENHIGIFAVLSAEVIDIEQVPNGMVDAYYEMDTYLQTYEEVEAYIVGVNYTVFEETNYYTNGINYRMVIIAKVDGQWYKVQEAHCTRSMLEDNGSQEYTKTALKALDEKESLALTGYRTLSKEQMENLEKAGGSILQPSVYAQVTDSAGTRAARAKIGVENHNVIKTIRVKMTRLYGQPVHSVNMEEYIKVVLANEVYPSWNGDALRACAMAVKMYGWYRVLVPKYPGMGYDVKDTSVDQNYNPSGANVGNANIVRACNDINTAILLNSDFNFFCTYYKAGPPNVDPYSVTTPYQANVSHPQYCGDLSQWGAQYLANNYGMIDWYILYFYYDYSGRPDGSTGQTYWFYYSDYFFGCYH